MRGSKSAPPLARARCIPPRLLARSGFWSSSRSGLPGAAPKSRQFAFPAPARHPGGRGGLERAWAFAHVREDSPRNMRWEAFPRQRKGFSGGGQTKRSGLPGAAPKFRRFAFPAPARHPGAFPARMRAGRRQCRRRTLGCPFVGEKGQPPAKANALVGNLPNAALGPRPLSPDPGLPPCRCRRRGDGSHVGCAGGGHLSLPSAANRL
jgi:hypothetical protein